MNSSNTYARIHHGKFWCVCCLMDKSHCMIKITKCRGVNGMFQKVTVLRKLQRILSGKGNKLFDNQVSFYNGIFGMTNK